MSRARLAVPDPGRHDIVPAVQKNHQVSNGPFNCSEEANGVVRTYCPFNMLLVTITLAANSANSEC